MQFHPAGVQVDHVLEFAPALLGQLHHVAHILLGADEADLYIGLLGKLDVRRVGVVQGVIHQEHLPIGFRHPVHNVGGGGDEVKIVFPLQPLLDDLHVQQPQKAAAEAKAQGDGAFQLVDEGGVVQLQLFESVP